MRSYQHQIAFIAKCLGTVLFVFFLTGCTKDAAKVLEARSMAACGCTTIKCLDEVKTQFAKKLEGFQQEQLNPEQKKRATLADEKLKGCIKELEANSAAGKR